jgi:hypothetical protein
MNRLLTLICALWLTALVWAIPSAELHQELIPQGEPVPFGKSVELILTLTYPPDVEPPPPDTLDIPGAHIIDRFQVQGPADGSHATLEYHLVFTRLEPGNFEIPPIQVGSATSQPVKVEFSGSTPLESDEDGEIRGPKSVVELSTADFWKMTLKWLVGILGVLVILGWLFSYLGILDRLRSPKGRALKQMKRLRKSRLGADETLLGCVEVLRSYLHEAYGFLTAEATSKEILNQLTMDNRCRGLKDSVQGLLESGDSLKFAKKSFAVSEVDDHFENLIGTLKAEPKVKS